jgi:hypothetical protein
VVSVDPERPLADLRGDGRIPVPIATDPRAPAKEGVDVRRSCACRFGIGGFAVAAWRPVERGVREAVETRDDTEERLVEERQRGPDLVERCRGDGSKVGGPPQQRDLLAEPPTQVAVLGRGQIAIVQPGEDPIDAAEREEQGSAAGLRRVGGEDRRDTQSGEEPVELVGACAGPTWPAGSAAELGQRARDRIGGRSIARRTFPPPGGPDPVTLLGEVHEAEVEAEGPDDDLGAPRVKAGELGGEGLAVGRVVLVPKADRGLADALDEVEQVPTGLLGDDLAEQRTEQPNLERQRVARPGGADRLRLGADGGVGGVADARARSCARGGAHAVLMRR